MDDEITRLLARAGSDPRSEEALFPLIYDELRGMARGLMHRERDGHTLDPTSLVNEAYLKLVGTDHSFKDRAHFFRVAARSMRRILVDHARTRLRLKRGGDQPRSSWSGEGPVGLERPRHLTALDEALDTLTRHDARKAQIVELHYFGGRQRDEIAQMLEISTTTVQRELNYARAWLRREMEGELAYKHPQRSHRTHERVFAIRATL